MGEIERDRAWDGFLEGLRDGITGALPPQVTPDAWELAEEAFNAGYRRGDENGFLRGASKTTIAAAPLYQERYQAGHDAAEAATVRAIADWVESQPFGMREFTPHQVAARIKRGSWRGHTKAAEGEPGGS